MTVLLPTDTVSLYPPGGADEHGWVSPPGSSDPTWVGDGSLQLGPGRTSVRASDDGGAGPFGPASAELGTVYLPTDAPAEDGMVLAARGRLFVLSQTRLVVDPSGGALDCVAASLTEVGQWAS